MVVVAKGEVAAVVGSGVTDPGSREVLRRNQVIDAIVKRAKGWLTRREADYILSDLTGWVRKANENDGVVTIRVTSMSGIVRDFIEGLRGRLKSVRPMIEQFLLQAVPAKDKLNIRRKRNNYQLNLSAA